MSDLIAPTIGIDRRRTNTADSMRAQAGPQYNINFSDVPNYTAGWMKAGAEAFNLADQITLDVRQSRAEADYNDFRIKMDQQATDLINSNMAGLTPEEMRTQVFDKMNKYAEDNLLNKEYMDDPRVKNKILQDYNGYVVNLSNTLYADNIKKVQDTLMKETSASFMIALNDAATAHNTKDGQKYVDIAKEKHDAMLRAAGVDPNSEQGRQSWKGSFSKLMLNNALQDLADPGMNPWALRTKVKAQQGVMMIEDYTHAMNAINAAIDRLNSKAESNRQRNIDNFMMSIGRGDERSVFAAAMNLAETYKKQNERDGVLSPYYGMTDGELKQKALTDTRAIQLDLRQQFDAETAYITTVQQQVKDALLKFEPDQRRLIVDYFQSGQATDEDVVFLSKGLDPRQASKSPKMVADAQQELLLNRMVATKNNDQSKAFDKFSNIKRNITMEGIRSTPFDQYETETSMVAGMSDIELTSALANSTSIDDFGRRLGLIDQSVINEAFSHAQDLSKKSANDLDESKLYAITDSLMPKIKSSFGWDKNFDKRNKSVLRGSIYRAVRDDFIKEQKEKPTLTIAEYYKQKLISGYSDTYVDIIKQSNYVTMFSNLNN